MASATINIDTKQIERLTKELHGFEKQVAKATSLALNRAVDHVYTQVGRIIPKSYAIKTNEVKASLKKNKTNKNSLDASVESKGHLLSFAHFPFSPSTPVIARTLGVKHSKARVKVTIKKGSRVISKKGFVATTGAKDGTKTQYNVFRRLGKSRLPIAPIRTLSIPQMITNEKVAEQVQQSAQDILDQRLDHEITRIMDSMDQNIRRK